MRIGIVPCAAGFRKLCLYAPAILRIVRPSTPSALFLLGIAFSDRVGRFWVKIWSVQMR